MASQSVSRQQGRIERMSQRSRRVLAVATLLGLPGMFAWSGYWLGTSVPSLVWGPISFLLVGVTAIGSLALYRFVRDRADMPGRRLDERQRQLRDRAWILSYQVLAAVVVLAVLVLALVVFGSGSPATIDGGLANAIVICVGSLLPVLPVAALAWIEPDAPADA